MEPHAKWIKFNISGTSCMVLKSTLSLPNRSQFLLKFSEAGHDERKQMADGYVESTEEYFFQQVPDVFKAILNFYIQGNLHKPSKYHYCSETFEDELKFWEVPLTALDACCKKHKQDSNSQTSGLGIKKGRPRVFSWASKKKHSNCLEVDLGQYKTEKFQRASSLLSIRQASGSRKKHSNCHDVDFQDETENFQRASSLLSVKQATGSTIRAISVDETKEDADVRRATDSLISLDWTAKSPTPRRGSFAKEMHLQLKQIWTHPQDVEQYKNAGGWRRRIRNLLEDPTSSWKAKVYSYISMIFVLTSVMGLLLGSMDQFQLENGSPILTLQVVEITCVGWFTLEYTIRFFIFPRKCEFIKETMNIIDVLSIVPFYLELLAYEAGLANKDSSIGNIKGLLMVIRVLRICKVARVLKLARHSGSLKGFGSAMSASGGQFRLLCIYIGTVILIFSSIIYFLEKDVPKTTFTSIPRSFWWCVVTMTTVGYGDMIPATIGGQVVASMATIMGVIVLAFPITVIVTTFGKVHEHEVIKPKGLHTN